MGKRIGRQEAHEVVYEAAMAAFEKGISFKEVLLNDQRVLKDFDVAEIDEVLDPHNYVGLAKEYVDSVLGSEHES
jgi:3-carboxy-cis,cis-muconate cycloisomerase